MRNISLISANSQGQQLSVSCQTYFVDQRGGLGGRRRRLSCEDGLGPDVSEEPPWITERREIVERRARRSLEQSAADLVAARGGRQAGRSGVGGPRGGHQAGRTDLGGSR